MTTKKVKLFVLIDGFTANCKDDLLMFKYEDPKVELFTSALQIFVLRFI